MCAAPSLCTSTSPKFRCLDLLLELIDLFRASGLSTVLSLSRRFVVAIRQVYEDRFLHDSHITLPTKHPPVIRWRQRFLGLCGGLLPVTLVEFPASLLTANTLREFSEVRCLTEIDASRLFTVILLVIHRVPKSTASGALFKSGFGYRHRTQQYHFLDELSGI